MKKKRQRSDLRNVHSPLHQSAADRALPAIAADIFAHLLPSFSLIRRCIQSQQAPEGTTHDQNRVWVSVDPSALTALERQKIATRVPPYALSAD